MHPLSQLAAVLPLVLLSTAVISFSTHLRHNHHSNRCGNASADIYQIAVLLPDLRHRPKPQYTFSIQYVRPAIELGLERVKDSGMLDRPVRVHYADSQCDISAAINQAFNFYMERQVDVFFGPFCDYAAAPVARQVVFWNVPMISSGAMTGDFQRRKAQQYPLLTRIGPTFESMSVFIVKVLLHFGWTKLMLLFDRYGQSSTVDECCHMAMESLHRILRDDSLKFNITHRHYSFNASKEDENSTSLLKNFVGTDFAKLFSA